LSERPSAFPPTGSSDLVALRAANNWDGPWFADQQLAVSLAKSVPVLFVDPTMSCLSDASISGLVRPAVSLLRPNLHRLTPVALPGRDRAGLSWLTSRIVARDIKSAARQLGLRVGTVIDCAPLAPVLGHCGEQRKVYWAQDDFEAMAALVGVSASRMRKGDRALALRADLVVASSPLVAGHITSMGAPVELIPFGCDPEVFGRSLHAQAAPDVTLPRPIAGFMGHLGERIDLNILTAIAETGTSLLLVGPRHPRFDIAGFQALLDRPTVQWVGAQQFDDLPSFLAAMDIGLVPYNHSPFNESSFPLKTLEYLAAGIPVVATDLPAIRWLDCPFIEVADSPSAFAAAVARLAAPTTQAASPQTLHDFARAHSWDARATQFLRTIAAIRGSDAD
jgi:teichuronic acid biosynthesis glycosyltransferase TuaH